jgi:hypothetical protein
MHHKFGGTLQGSHAGEAALPLCARRILCCATAVFPFLVPGCFGDHLDREADAVLRHTCPGKEAADHKAGAVPVVRACWGPIPHQQGIGCDLPDDLVKPGAVDLGGLAVLFPFDGLPTLMGRSGEHRLRPHSAAADPQLEQPDVRLSCGFFRNGIGTGFQPREIYPRAISKGVMAMPIRCILDTTAMRCSRRDEVGKQRDDFGMAGGDRGRRRKAPSG